ncbi:MAG: hypothetical protein CMA27_02950 [Euryarchaeota archaeon]|nr:hypothetical protein [Euryarchaeota archaeon]
MTDISDLSNNQDNFIQLLADYINITNSNSNPLPLSNNYMLNQSLPSQYSRFNRILNRSFLEKPVYKKILSNKGTNQLKTIIYDDKKYETKECVISMNEFKNGDEIIQLPCKHIFHKESIETWLKEESSKCPVCRFELDYKEVKNNDNIIVEDFDASNNTTTDTSNNVFNRFFSNMDLIYNPTQNIFRPQRNNLLSQRNLINEIINEENSYLEQRYLQNAIMASLYEEYPIENNDSDEDSSLEDFIDIFLEEEEKENDLISDSDDDDLYGVN